MQLSILTSCSTTTITGEPGNYNYSINEEIKIIDIDSRETIGTVKLTGFTILKDEPFELEITDDENSQVEYITCNQVIQFYYVYTTTDRFKSITDLNFTIWDNRKEIAIRNPNTDYVEEPKDGEHSFVMAIKNKSDFLYIDFNYGVFQMIPTAKIKINISDQALQEENPSDNDETNNSKEKSSENDKTINSEEISSNPKALSSSLNQSNFELSNYLKYDRLFIIAVLLLATVITLSILLINHHSKK